MDTATQVIDAEKRQDWLYTDMATDEEQPCEHMPESLNFTDWSYKYNCVHCYFKCTCGKTITETFYFSDRHAA